MRFTPLAGAAAALTLLAGASAVADASEPIVQRTDPQASSPAGVIYQIPLDTGRREAAPVLPVGSHGGGGAGASGAAAAASSSGSGSGGAGTGGAGAGGSAGASGATASARTPGAGGGTPSDPSSIHSENGFGSSSQVPGVSPGAVAIGAGVPSAHVAGSTLPSYVLILLIAVAAVAVGVLGARASRRRNTGGSPPAPSA